MTQILSVCTVQCFFFINSDSVVYYVLQYLVTHFNGCNILTHAVNHSSTIRPWCVGQWWFNSKLSSCNICVHRIYTSCTHFNHYLHVRSIEAIFQSNRNIILHSLCVLSQKFDKLLCPRGNEFHICAWYIGYGIWYNMGRVGNIFSKTLPRNHGKATHVRNQDTAFLVTKRKL